MSGNNQRPVRPVEFTDMYEFKERLIIALRRKGVVFYEQEENLFRKKVTIQVEDNGAVFMLMASGDTNPDSRVRNLARDYGFKREDVKGQEAYRLPLNPADLKVKQ